VTLTEKIRLVTSIVCIVAAVVVLVLGRRYCRQGRAAYDQADLLLRQAEERYARIADALAGPPEQP
jgi:hypothetical protein